MTLEVVAAHSKKAVHEALPRGSRFELSEACHAEEVALALSAPGVIFYSPLDQSPPAWSRDPRFSVPVDAPRVTASVEEPELDHSL